MQFTTALLRPHDNDVPIAIPSPLLPEQNTIEGAVEAAKALLSSADRPPAIVGFRVFEMATGTTVHNEIIDA